LPSALVSPNHSLTYSESWPWPPLKSSTSSIVLGSWTSSAIKRQSSEDRSLSSVTRSGAVAFAANRAMRAYGRLGHAGSKGMAMCSKARKLGSWCIAARLGRMRAGALGITESSMALRRRSQGVGRDQ
jgi:hypothetical protein